MLGYQRRERKSCDNKRSIGWIYRTDKKAGKPRLIEVHLSESKVLAGAEVVVDFEDSMNGVREASERITEELGRDDWTLKDMYFLGYRIEVPYDTE